MMLETNRLIIRTIESGDEVVFARMAKDGSLQQDIGFDPEFEKWMSDWVWDALRYAKEDDPTKEFIANTICLKETGEIIGSVGCTYFEQLKETGITFFLGKEYRGYGYAYEAVEEYIRYLFLHYPIGKLISLVRPENSKSVRLHEKLGFLLLEQKKYRDLDDEEEVFYSIYKLEK